MLALTIAIPSGSTLFALPVVFILLYKLRSFLRKHPWKRYQVSSAADDFVTESITAPSLQPDVAFDDVTPFDEIPPEPTPVPRMVVEDVSEEDFFPPPQPTRETPRATLARAAKLAYDASLLRAPADVMGAMSTLVTTIEQATVSVLETYDLSPLPDLPSPSLMPTVQQSLRLSPSTNFLQAPSEPAPAASEKLPTLSDPEPQPPLQLLSVQAIPPQPPPPPSSRPDPKRPLITDVSPAPPPCLQSKDGEKSRASGGDKKEAKKKGTEKVESKQQDQQEKIRERNRKLEAERKEAKLGKLVAKHKSWLATRLGLGTAAPSQTIPSLILPNEMLVRPPEGPTSRPRLIACKKPPRFRKPAKTPFVPAEEDVPRPEEDVEPPERLPKKPKKLLWRTKKLPPPEPTTYSAAGATFSDCPAGAIHQVWGTDEASAPIPWVPDPKPTPPPATDLVDKKHVALVAAQRSVEWARSELARQQEQKVALEKKLQEVRNEVAALQREVKARRPRPPTPPLQGPDAMASGDLMAQFLSPEEIAKSSREASKARRKTQPNRINQQGQTPAVAAAEKALLSMRARERAAVCAVEACQKSIEIAEQEAAKAQDAVEAIVRTKVKHEI